MNESRSPQALLSVCLAVSGLLLAPPTIAAQEAPVARRANQVAELFRADPGGYEDVFAPDFLANVPVPALDDIFTRYHAEHGSVRATTIVGPFTQGSTIVRFTFADGSAALMQLSLEPGEPYRIAGGLIGPPYRPAGAETEADTGADAAAPTSGAYEVREATYPSDAYETKTSLRLPFSGEWWVFWGGREIGKNYHRSSPQQRYAYDFVIRRDGSTHAGAGERNEDFWCEGTPLLAPAAGIVVRAVDGVPENVPGERNGDQKLGNHVVIDHGDGEYSLLAHLRTGSVAVAPGDTVAAAQQVGACGNSGNSSEPHLHYQLQTGPDFYESESVPAPFRDYVADGQPVEQGEPERGQSIAPLHD